MAAPTLGSPRSNPRNINYLRIGIALLFIAVGLYVQWKSTHTPPQTEQAKLPTPVAKSEGTKPVAAAKEDSDSSGGAPLELPAKKPATSAAASKSTGTSPAPVTRPPPPPPKDAAKPATSSEKSGEKKTSNMQIPNLTIRNQDGDVVFKGTVDISETVARIQAGEKLSRFGHDGITFENRERRLPQKPKGYYHEYVHPTTGVGGPGPQRVVMGEEGEIWFTHDHYRTFKRINP